MRFEYEVLVRLKAELLLSDLGAVLVEREERERPRRGQGRRQ
jgi:hypothetical protein